MPNVKHSAKVVVALAKALVAKRGKPGETVKVTSDEAAELSGLTEYQVDSIVRNHRIVLEAQFPPDLVFTYLPFSRVIQLYRLQNVRPEDL